MPIRVTPEFEDGESAVGHRRVGRTWSRPKRQVSIRIALLAFTYLVYFAGAIVLFWRHGITRTVLSSVTNGTVVNTTFSQPNESIYQMNPRAVVVLLVLVAVAILVSTLSFIIRVNRRSSKASPLGIAVASVAGAIGVLAMFSVGPLIIAIAAPLLIVATPMEDLGQ